MPSSVHKKRGWQLLGASVCMGLVVYCVLTALKSNINLFFTPARVVATSPHPRALIRVGGVVTPQSVHYQDSSDSSTAINLQFKIHDNDTRVNVVYQGVLPDLFREGQGVVVQGYWQASSQTVRAVQVLAKHDETYQPPALVQALAAKEQG